MRRFVTPGHIWRSDHEVFRALGIVVVLWPLSAAIGEAQVVVSANDSKATLIDGVNTPVRNPPPDTVTIIDLSASPPKVIGEVRAPNSVVGPPQTVAIAPDESIALVASSTKLDSAAPAGTAPDDLVTVIDLKASPPAVLATVHAGRGASGISFNPAGTLALVANRMEGTVSIFTVNGKTVTPAGKVDLGAPESGPSHVAFTRDGRMALVTRNNDSFISLLAVDGTSVTYAKRDIAAGLKPYGLEVSPTADLAFTGNIGAGASGGADTISVIDLAANPPRAIDHVTVGPIAEGIALSSDGQYLVRDGHERHERAEGVAALQRFRPIAGLRREEQDADADRRGADRPLVPGDGLEPRQPDGPGAVHGREGDPDLPVRRHDSVTRRIHQGQRRPCRDSRRGKALSA